MERTEFHRDIEPQSIPGAIIYIARSIDGTILVPYWITSRIKSYTGISENTKTY